ncbi:MAG TPA: peptidylprolyl isomerase [Bryobacteraceae bacterium]|nr:peptidylprolyl isomerase [Bryobacteraceae bacterium]
MRRASAVVLNAAACLALAGCSPTEMTKNPEPAPAPKNEQAPDVFRAHLDTSKGVVVIEVHRDWAPRGADHFYSLVKTGFYDGNRFFRYVRNFIVQFGINGDPKVNRLWSNANLPDDPVKQSNATGTVVYATSGPNTRSTQLFINLRNNAALDKQGFAPFGKVVAGMDVVEILYSSYGDMPAMGGQGPDPSKIETQGNDYLANNFARLDYIKKATIE